MVLLAIAALSFHPDFDLTSGSTSSASESAVYGQQLLRGLPAGATGPSLRASAIDVDSARQAPRSIPGTVPDPLRLPPGCPFQPRCPIAQPDCATGPVALREIAPGRAVACLHHDALTGQAGASAGSARG